MKKVLLVFMASILGIFTLYSGNFTVKGYDNQKDIASKIIRFHVIANSDSKDDQALKLKVRDEVLKYIAPKLKESRSIEESRKILMDNNKQMISIAETVIRNHGYSYSVKSTLSKVNFPIKTYGNITLPQGKYEAYRILIGSGEGQNWWCVMFPPLCFVDITKGQVSYKQTEDEMKKVLTSEEYKSVDNRITNINDKKTLNQGGNNVQVRFKVVDVMKNIDKKKSTKNNKDIKKSKEIKNNKDYEDKEINYDRNMEKHESKK